MAIAKATVAAATRKIIRRADNIRHIKPPNITTSKTNNAVLWGSSISGLQIRGTLAFTLRRRAALTAPSRE
jgi:hypothetical protein